MFLQGKQQFCGVVGTAEAARGRGFKAEAVGLGSLTFYLGEEAFWGYRQLG